MSSFGRTREKTTTRSNGKEQKQLVVHRLPVQSSTSREHQQYQQTSNVSSIAATAGGGSGGSSTSSKTKLVLHQQQENPHQKKSHIVAVSRGDGVGGNGSNNLIIGNICGGSSCVCGIASIPSYGCSCGDRTSNSTAARVTPPTKRVKAKLLIRKGNNGDWGNQGRNVLYQEYVPSSRNYLDGGGPERTSGNLYFNPVVDVISDGEQYDSGGGKPGPYFYQSSSYNDFYAQKRQHCGVETRLLVTSTSGAQLFPKSSFGSRGPSPSSSVDRVVKLTTRVTTLEEILSRSEQRLHQQDLYSYTAGTKFTSYSCVKMESENGIHNEDNLEEGNVNISDSSDAVGTERCTSSTPAAPKKSVQFTRTTSSARHPMSAPSPSSQFSSSKATPGPCTSASVAIPSSSKSQQHLQASSLSMSPPRITISPLPESEKLGTGRHSNLSVSSVPREPDNSSCASSSSDPISDCGEHEIIDPHGDLNRSRGASAGSGSLHRKRCCRRFCCYYFCCSCYSPSSCSRCCKKSGSKHQGNYSQGPTIDSEPVAGSTASGLQGTSTISVSTGPVEGPHLQSYNVSGTSGLSDVRETSGSFHRRVAPFLPLCLVSVFGFISKLFCGLLETLFGVDRSAYSDHGKDGEGTEIL